MSLFEGRGKHLSDINTLELILSEHPGGTGKQEATQSKKCPASSTGQWRGVNSKELHWTQLRPAQRQRQGLSSRRNWGCRSEKPLQSVLSVGQLVSRREERGPLMAGCVHTKWWRMLQQQGDSRSYDGCWCHPGHPPLVSYMITTLSCELFLALVTCNKSSCDLTAPPPSTIYTTHIAWSPRVF